MHADVNSVNTNGCRVLRFRMADVLGRLEPAAVSLNLTAAFLVCLAEISALQYQLYSHNGMICGVCRSVKCYSIWT